jgi:hypothetical protein
MVSRPLASLGGCEFPAVGTAGLAGFVFGAFFGRDLFVAFSCLFEAITVLLFKSIVAYHNRHQI